MKRKVWSLIMTAALCVGLAACGGGGDSREAASSSSGGDASAAASVSSESAGEETGGEVHEIRMPISADIADINVHLYDGNMLAQGMFFEGLVVYDHGEVKPALAESWEISEDGRLYTFHLREGVSFTDGEPCDAEAVKANFEAVLRNSERHNWLVSSTKIQEVKAVDASTVTIALSEAYYPFMTELSLVRPYRMMSPKSFVDGETMNGVSYLAGTGAYILEEKVDDQYAVFVANKDYWAGAPAYDKVTFKVMPAGETTQLAFQNGEVNFLFGTYATGMVDPEIVKSYEQNPDYQVLYSEPISSRYLMVNCNPARPTTDKNVRNAIWRSIDREGLCQGVFSGMDLPADKLFDKTMPNCDVELENKSYDIEAAKKLVEESGWKLSEGSGIYEKDGQELKVQLLYNSSLATNKTICELIQANLKEAGILAELVPVEKSSLYDRRAAGDYDILLDATWGIPYDPQSCITGVLSSSSYAPAVETLDSYQELCDTIQAALVSVDETERQKLWDKILTIVHEDASFIPLSYSRSSIVTTKDMQGVVFGDTQYDVPFYKYHF